MHGVPPLPSCWIGGHRHAPLNVLGHHAGHLANALKHLVDGSTGAAPLAWQSIPVVLVPAAQA